MSSSMMPLWKLPSTILVITLVTGIVHSMPNTFWSKRSGQQEISDKMLKDGSQNFSESQPKEKISKFLREFIVRPFSTLLYKIKHQKQKRQRVKIGGSCSVKI